ncbi:hypothetical protein [Paenibacillus amylolyticus]|uniref:hypothetical protein n=1 Tax=Paenibacillus amylolyticus TaxID=1451 RepID=UPI00201D80D4|nr:hypothetical protein [Paenibacillus amylolyticus]MCL6663520.1 hypothetical protein [Paenibacillus amylolyticus]
MNYTPPKRWGASWSIEQLLQVYHLVGELQQVVSSIPIPIMYGLTGWTQHKKASYGTLLGV